MFALKVRLTLTFLFVCSTLAYCCTCGFTDSFCAYSSALLGDGTQATVTRATFLEYRNPEIGAYLYDFVVREHLYGTMNADTVTLWGQDGGNCNGPVRQMTEGRDYLLVHRSAQSIFSYYSHTLENFDNPYPIFDFQGCGESALEIQGDTVYGAISPGINELSLAELYTDLEDCFKDGLISGTHELNLPGLRLFPVPATDHLTVRWQRPSVQTAGVFNTAGQMVVSTRLGGGQTELSLPVHQLPAGTYYLRLSNGTAFTTRKFVVR